MNTPSIWTHLRHVLGGYPNTAAEWAVRVQCPDVTRQELLVLDQWLKADPRNAQAYAEINKVSYLGLQLREQRAELTRLESYQRLRAAERQSERSAPARLSRLTPSLAGSCALLMVTVMVGWFWYSNDRYSVGHGEQQRVTLSDGSSIVVNTDSEVKVLYSDSSRVVALPRGEAFFEVAKNPERPFIVRTDDLEVRAIGTKFSVRRTEGGTQVVVSEGRVRVSRIDIARAPQVDLIANMRVNVAPEVPIPAPIAIDAAAATSWTGGAIQFDDEPLLDVLREVNRYTGKPFVIADPALESVRLSGRFRIGDMESVTFALTSRFDIVVTEEQGEIRLHRR